MDSVPTELPQNLSSPAVDGCARSQRRPTPPDASFLKLERPAEVRFHLQRRAPANLRRHVGRAFARLAVLMAADLATFGALRELIRLARAEVAVGTAAGTWVRATLPAGYLNGWQFATALFLSLIVMGTYGPGDRRRDVGRLLAACFLATALPLWAAAWTRGMGTVLEQYVLTVGLVWGALAAERLTIDRIKGTVRPAGRDALDTLFVGPGGACLAAIERPAFAMGADYRPIGFVDTETPPTSGAVGHINDLSVLLAACGARAVVLCGYLSEVHFQEVVDTALTAGCQVLSVPRTPEIAGVHPAIVWRGGHPLVELTAPSLKGWQLFLKRLLDLAGGVCGVMVLSPVLALVSAAIKLESRGCVVFGHRRLGLNGRPFLCYKFRSMRVDADEQLHSDPELYAKYVANNYKLPGGDDPRLTWVGQLLRRTSLDELPQLFNVIAGQMSLVGPRPIVPEELGQYGHGAGVLLSLKPGITGAWAVNGRSDVAYPDRADIELDYVRNWSLVRDVWILLTTIPAVLRQRGAH